MVVGIDVHRDRTTQKTVVAASAAWNKTFSLYFNTATFATDDEDVLNKVSVVIKGMKHAGTYMRPH